MPALSAPHRPARKDDALAMAELVDMAGEGMPLYLWRGMAAPDESPWAVGTERARRETGAFSYRNAIVHEEDDTVAALLVGYPLDDDPAPVDYTDMPPMFVPLQQLEDMAPGTWYVNVLATYPTWRCRGFGGGLLSIADTIARETGKRGLSIIVSDANTDARRLYERHGYQQRASRPMVKDDWENPGRHWVLLTKDV